ncbi:MAG: hypothetical protein NVSMB8_11900 [Candidatus Limnocylindrales bacterium]
MLLGALLLVGIARDPASGSATGAADACRPVTGLALRFCPDVRPLHAATDPGAVAVDQMRPCEPSAALPTFCVALPAHGVAPDPDTLAVSRQRACAQLAPKEAPTFCLSLAPGTGSATLERDLALALLRQRIGDAVRRVGPAPPDLWVEDGVPVTTAAQLRTILVDDMAAVRDYFGRDFLRVPAVFVFATRGSFAAALERHFGYPAAVAARLAMQSGGLLVTGLDAIVINAENVLGGRSLTILRHELTHVLLHDLAGDGRLPAWLDEGLATIVELGGANDQRERLVSLSLAAERRVSLSSLSDPGEWLSQNDRLAGHGYGIAAAAAQLLLDRLGSGGLVPLLEAVGRGGSLADAYRAQSTETLAPFDAAVPPRALASSCGRGIATDAPGADGLTIYQLYGFPPSTAVSVSVDRATTPLAFSVTTDAVGAYAGTLGGTMAPGLYRVRASFALGGVEVDVPVGPGTGRAARSCRT